MNDNVILDKILTTKYWNKKILKEKLMLIKIILDIARGC